MQIHIEKSDNLIGFAIENVASQNMAKILTRASLTSDDPDFYKYIDQISNIFFSKTGVFSNSVFQFLVLIHEDLSADLYVNEFKVSIKVMSKRSIEKGEVVTQNDIADIRELSFPDIKIAQTDKVIYSFKVGWKFGLFFDLYREENLLDIEKMYLALGELYRYLSFQDVYKVLETTNQFEEMKNDGWFPFIELLDMNIKF